MRRRAHPIWLWSSQPESVVGSATSSCGWAYCADATERALIRSQYRPPQRGSEQRKRGSGTASLLRKCEVLGGGLGTGLCSALVVRCLLYTSDAADDLTRVD